MTANPRKMLNLLSDRGAVQDTDTLPNLPLGGATLLSSTMLALRTYMAGFLAKIDLSNVDPATGRAALSVPSFLASIFLIDTIATLRLLRVAGRLSGVCFVSGYAAAGDGGQGLFVYIAADTTTNDNGGTIIVDVDGGRWYRAAGSQ